MADWNFETMYAFIRNFDPAEQKYLRHVPEERLKVSRQEKLREKLDEYQKMRTKERWNLEDIEDTVLTVEKVYGRGTDDLFGVIKEASEKFLDQYVEIEGTGQLFKASYFYFEWMMHLEYNQDKHDYTYYRDHYVHQVRNMYEMFQFLDELKYEEKCYRIYRELDNEVGRLIRAAVEEEMNVVSEKEKEIWDTFGLSGEALEKMLYSYLFHAAAIIASLMHDIGYPIAYVGRTVRKLGIFLPFTNLFVEEADTMATIHSVLQDSLLYRVIGQKEVAKQVSKRDHGALSAVILLYKYYDNGKIASLSPVKKAVIELGALMIYNHTMKYEIMGEKESHYYKNIFRDNPMSYLFRLCDDLQEWDRSYFEISGRSNFFICGDCLMPLTRKAGNNKGVEEEKSYSCWCGEKKGMNTTTFHYRKLFNVEACRGVKITKAEAKDGKKETQAIRMLYDKGKMLQLAAYSPNYALKRAEGMWEIKKMLAWQQDFPDTYLDFLTSNNPVLLKAEIVGEWFDGLGDRTSFSVWKLLKDDFQKKKGEPEALWLLFEPLMELMSNEMFQRGYQRDQRELKKQLSKVQPKWEGKSKSIAYIWKKFYFYYCLALWGRILSGIEKDRLTKADCEDWKKSKGIIAITARKLRTVICQRFGVEDRDTKNLVESYFVQKMLQFSEEQYRKIRSRRERDMYYDSFLLNASDTNTVKSYVQGWTYDEIKEEVREKKGTAEQVKERYDYYSDYYLYYTMAKLLR